MYTGLIIVIVIFFHLLVPLAFLFWLYKSKVSSKLGWTSIALAVLGYLAFLGKAGAGWGWVGYYWPIFFLIAFLPVAFTSAIQRKDLPWLPPKKFTSWLNMGINFLMVIFFVSNTTSVILARSFPQNKAISLTFPLNNGTFLIGHGGSNIAVNHHFEVPAQKYALDILALNGWGTRANGLMPQDPQKYVIFASEVVAPCSGEVLASKANLPDQKIPDMDPENLLGNHLIIYCQDSSVLLAHLKQKSLKVETGDQVEAGQVMAEVGNTGNTSEPHLHIHVVAGKHVEVEEIAGMAEGIPMLFEGKFLVRNDRVAN